MGSSIQDYAKKINSKTTLFDCVSLLITTIFLLSFTIFLYYRQKALSIPVTYVTGGEIVENNEIAGETLPFASISGKTYTFSWCMGANRVAVKNRIYFANEDEAIRSGRRLSKLCTK